MCTTAWQLVRAGPRAGPADLLAETRSGLRDGGGAVRRRGLDGRDRAGRAGLHDTGHAAAGQHEHRDRRRYRDAGLPSRRPDAPAALSYPGPGTG